MGAIRKMQRAKAKARRSQLTADDEAILSIVRRQLARFRQKFGREPVDTESIFFDPEYEVPTERSEQGRREEFHRLIEELLSNGKMRLEFVAASALAGCFISPRVIAMSVLHPETATEDDNMNTNAAAWAFHMMDTHGADALRRAVRDHCRVMCSDDQSEHSALEMMLELADAVLEAKVVRTSKIVLPE